MSGIPVYTQSPISAAKKADGTTPQTAAPGNPTSSAPYSNPTTTTYTASSTYPAAQPGQAAVPAPTGAPSAAFSRYAPPNATPTKTTQQDDGPPPPQAGQVPTPMRANLPPPPKVGEVYTPAAVQTGQAQLHQQYGAPPQFGQHYQQPQQGGYMPPQMNIPPPTNAYGAQPPSSSTGTTDNLWQGQGTQGLGQGSYPVSLPVPSNGDTGRRSLDHPPGYVQNSGAQDMSADQRRASEVNDVRYGGLTSSISQMGSNIGSNFSGSASSSNYVPSHKYSESNTGGIGKPFEGPTAAYGVNPEAVWNTAKKWAGTFGQKLSETEAEVWKRVNGEK